MAITVMSSVPTSSGIRPKEAGVPVGDQWLPNRNSMGETERKKIIVSNSTEKTMPMVVSTATAEQATRTTSTTRSKALRARKSAALRE